MSAKPPKKQTFSSGDWCYFPTDFRDFIVLVVKVTRQKVHVYVPEFDMTLTFSKADARKDLRKSSLMGLVTDV